MTAAACTVKTEGPATPAATGSDAPAEVQALFATLPAATPDQLRGVWATTLKLDEGQGQGELRFRFTDAKIVGGVQCTYTVAGAPPLLVGDSGAITTADLDAKAGQFVLPTKLTFAGRRDVRSCSGAFNAATWKFTITGTSVDMDAVGMNGQIHLDKVGD